MVAVYSSMRFWAGYLGWFSSYSAWVFPALVAGLLAAMTLAGLPFPAVLRRSRHRIRAEA